MPEETPRPTVFLRFAVTGKGQAARVDFTAASDDGGVGRADGRDAGPVDAVEPIRAEGPFIVDLQSARFSRLLGTIASNQAKLEELRDVGAQLWAGLLPDQVDTALRDARKRWNARKPFYQVRLSLPEELQALPWEAMHDAIGVGLLSQTPDYCVVHETPQRIEPPVVAAHKDEVLRILLVIPEGSGLNVGRELRALQTVVEREPRTVVHLDAMRGRVTPGGLAEALRTPRDVVHFIGHGGLDPAGRIQLRFNSEDQSVAAQDVDIETFATMFRTGDVRLVVLNSCSGVTPSAQQSLCSAGPMLMRAGIPAVIAMRYEVDDRDAITFSREFYGELVRTGRVDHGVQWARHNLSLSATPDQVQGFVAPVLYLAEQVPRLFKPAPLKRVTPRPPEIGPGLKAPLPPDLVQATRGRRCVLVVGPRLFREGATRDQAAPPGPKELADILKEKFGYPDEADFQASDVADWIENDLLQRVCQHCLASGTPTYEVVRVIADTYQLCKPPRCFDNLAQWPVPGIICTYIDGLMWHALSQRSRPPRVMNRVDKQSDMGDSHTLLVNLRGSVADSQSLILTEEDHDLLWDQMADLAPVISDLVHKESGRTLLFCGVDPADSVVRRFVSCLLPHGRTRNQGEIYWVLDRQSKADIAYWDRKYQVRWIVEQAQPVIEALTGLALPGGES